jgi:hypothetical protein
MRRLRLPVTLSLVVCVLGYLSAGAVAANVPAPPCNGTSAASSADVGAAPAVTLWHQGDLGANWAPPACVGWSAGQPTAVLALAGSFRLQGGAEDLLARFGAISSMTGMRYWSVGDRSWRELITSAGAVEGGKSLKPRADFTTAEMLRGQDLYFQQSDSRSSAPVIYRMRVLQMGPERVVIEMENVSPVRLLLFSVYAAGDLKATYFLDRVGKDRWSYYSLSSVHETGVGGLTGNHDSSYINRAVALYRHVAGIPTDQDPPLALQ